MPADISGWLPRVQRNRGRSCQSAKPAEAELISARCRLTNCWPTCILLPAIIVGRAAGGWSWRRPRTGWRRSRGLSSLGRHLAARICSQSSALPLARWRLCFLRNTTIAGFRSAPLSVDLGSSQANWARLGGALGRGIRLSLSNIEGRRGFQQSEQRVCLNRWFYEARRT